MDIGPKKGNNIKVGKNITNKMIENCFLDQYKSSTYVPKNNNIEN